MRMRDQAWLENALVEVWNKHFSDIIRVNPIAIRWGRKSGQRLGSIILTKEGVSRITITSLFKDEGIPEYIIYETIAHELIHYIHGFSSKIKRTFKYPHQGGIIRIEMEKRGLGTTYRKTKTWMRRNWTAYVLAHRRANPPKKRKRPNIKRFFRIRFV